VQDFNQRQNDLIFRGLVQPTDAELILNGRSTEYHLKRKRPLDWRPQFDKALETFERNGFFILVDDKQAESLDQEFLVSPRTEVSFVKLTLLVGAERCLPQPSLPPGGGGVGSDVSRQSTGGPKLPPVAPRPW
jgi:hypothetical protein